jgi:hypothetical protein
VDGRQADRISITPGDVRVAYGDPLTVQVKLNEAIRGDVELRTRSSQHSERIEQMQSQINNGEPPRQYTTRFPQVTENFEYRIRADRSLSKFHRVQVFPRPEITQLHLHTEYPEYTGRESRQTSGIPERITALAGSTLTLSIETNVELATAELVIGEESLGTGTVTTLNGESVRQWRVPVDPPAETRRWRVELESKEGFTNHILHRSLVVEEDHAPVVTLLHPTRTSIELPPKGFISLRYGVKEDFGISKVELHVQVDEGAAQIIPQTLPEAVGSDRKGTIPLNLSTLNLGNARTVKASIHVFDTLPETNGGPNQGVSDTLTINLTASSESLNRQTIAEDRELAAKTLAQIIAELERILESTDTLHEHTQSEEEEAKTKATNLAANIRRELGWVYAEVLTLSRSLKDRFLTSLAVILDRVSRQQLREAQRLSQTYSLTDVQSEKLEIISSLQTQIQQALDELRQVQTQLDPLADQAERLADLMDIQHQQEYLVDETTQEDWESQLEEWQQLQEELAEQLAAITEQDEARQQLSEEIQEAVDDLMQAASDAMEAANLAEELDTPSWMEAQQEAQTAQQTVESAQQEAAEAQEAAVQAQEAAQNADTPEAAQEAAEAAAEAQQTAEQAQAAAEQAQQQAVEAQQNAEQMQRDAGLETAADAQREAIQSQQEAQTAQQQAQEEQQGAEQAQQQAAENGTPEAQQAAQEAQEAAQESQQAAAEAHQQAQALQEHALSEALQEALQTEEGQPLREAMQAAQDAHEAAQQAAESADEATQTADDAEFSETSEQMGELAENVRDAAMPLAEAAQHPGDPEAAQAMADSADQLQQAAQELQAMMPPDPTAEQLAQAESTQAAQESTSKAAQAAAEGEAEQAAQHAADAAEQLQQQNQEMAQAMGLSEESLAPGMMPQPPGPPSDEPSEGENMAEWPQSEAVPQWATEIGLTAEDWIRMRGETGRTGEAVDDSSIPAEYRGLVQDYFRQLSRE